MKFIKFIEFFIYYFHNNYKMVESNKASQSKESSADAHGRQKSLNDESVPKFVTPEQQEESKGEARSQPQMPAPIRLVSQNSAPPMMPMTSKGEGGRPVGEPEAFSDYSLIYEMMKKRGKNTGKKTE